MYTLDTILEKLRRHKPELQRKYHISQMGVCGSYARGEATEKSDIENDILSKGVPSLAFLVFISFMPFLGWSQSVKVSIHGRDFNGILTKGNFILLSSRGDTVLNRKVNYYVDFKFQDIDRDGNKDILLTVNDNIPDTYDLLLYEPNPHKFKEVSEFYRVPRPRRLKGTIYYYSYFHAGCADDTWGSRLFFIKDFKVIKIGFINGEGCGIKDGIYIYRQVGRNKKLLKVLPLATIERYKQYKWGFLKEYWTNHYSEFLPIR